MIFTLHTFDRKFCIKKNQPSFKAYSAIFKLKSAPAMFTSQYCPQLKVEHYHLKQILVPVTFQKLTPPTDTSLVLSLIILGIKFRYYFVLMWILGQLHSHCYSTRLNPTKKGPFQFCFPALLGIHQHPMQKEFFRSTEGFLRAALTGHGHPGPL